MTPESIVFAMPGDAQSMEMGTVFSPRFDVSGLIPTVAIHAETGEILMLAYMNVEALRLTLASGDAHYFSRSRQAIWRKGETSGQVQRLVEMRVDCDQDALVLRVIPQGDGKSCHVGYRSCFYRSVTIEANGKANLVFSAV